MAAASLALHLSLAAAIALMTLGAATAWTSAAFSKRIVGVLLALSGAVLALSVLGAPGALMIAGAATAFAFAAIGAGLLVRLQEEYGSTELAEIDKADAEAEPAEREA
jgi:hypothetical protein